MADGGQGFFKICMSIIPKKETPIDEDSCNEMTAKKIKLDSHSKDSSKKSTSVKKLILLCIVPSIKETYNNIKILFDLIRINDISFKFVSDFKVLLIINGQQTATSSFPCP